jgi:hypothetical protein
MKIAILQNTQSPATDVYRTVHPFRQLGHETIIIDPANPKWFDLLECEILVSSRPNGTLIHSILSEFKRTGKGKKIIVDCDDNLHELDPSNPSYPHFNSPAVKESVVACMNLADHIIFSTKALQDYYTQEKKIMQGEQEITIQALTSTPSTVVHNAVDFNLTPMMKPRPINKPVRVLWRGSEHHLKDLETIRPFWDWILKEPGYDVLFMGLQPHIVNTYFPGAKCVTWNPSPFAFWEKQASLKADVGIFPLCKTLFNLGKSDIFAQEQFCNGVLPIVSLGFPEFMHDGTVLFRDSDGLKMWFELESKVETRTSFIEKGQSWLLENRNLATVNLKRGEIIEGL